MGIVKAILHLLQWQPAQQGAFRIHFRLYRIARKMDQTAIMRKKRFYHFRSGNLIVPELSDISTSFVTFFNSLVRKSAGFDADYIVPPRFWTNVVNWLKVAVIVKWFPSQYVKWSSILTVTPTLLNTSWKQIFQTGAQQILTTILSPTSKYKRVIFISNLLVYFGFGYCYEDRGLKRLWWSDQKTS